MPCNVPGEPATCPVLRAPWHVLLIRPRLEQRNAPPLRPFKFRIDPDALVEFSGLFEPSLEDQGAFLVS